MLCTLSLLNDDPARNPVFLTPSWIPYLSLPLFASVHSPLFSPCRCYFCHFCTSILALLSTPLCPSEELETLNQQDVPHSPLFLVHSPDPLSLHTHSHTRAVHNFCLPIYICSFRNFLSVALSTCTYCVFALIDDDPSLSLSLSLSLSHSLSLYPLVNLILCLSSCSCRAVFD